MFNEDPYCGGDGGFKKWNMGETLVASWLIYNIYA
jgi:hypothetical protein